jgi:VWFA-related protein
MSPGNLRSRRRRAPRRAVLSATLLAALGLPAAAAPPAPAAKAPAERADETFYESIDVDVVNVEVVATDRAGRPVSGLAKEDFELYEDGRPVAISNFFRSAGEPSGQPAADRPAAPGRPAAPKPTDQVLNFAVFVDNENLTQNARRPVLGALQDFFRAHVGAGDHVILASYDGGIKVSQPAAEDPAAVDAAMTRMMMTVTRGGLAVQRQGELRRLQQDLAEGAGPDAAVEFSELNQDVQLGGSLDVESGRRGLAVLADFITSLAGLPGRKALVVVTGAFALQADPLLVRIAEHANANRVTIYVLGAVDPPAAGQFRAPVAIGNDTQGAVDALTGGLHSVADRTGGLTAANRIDPRTFLEQIRGDVETYYSLGFAPGHKRDGKLHKLAVKLKGRGDLALRYRESYEDRNGDQRAAAETLSALVLGGGDNPLGVELSFEPTKPAAGKGAAMLPVVVHVPLAKLVLIPQERFHEGKLTLFVATRDERGRVSGLRRLDAPVHVANDRLMGSLGQSVAYRVEVPLRQGERTVAVGVRDEVGHVDSTAWSALGPGSH